MIHKTEAGIFRGESDFRRQQKEQRDERIRKLGAEGLRVCEIAERLNVSKCVVSRALAQMKELA